MSVKAEFGFMIPKTVIYFDNNPDALAVLDQWLEVADIIEKHCPQLYKVLYSVMRAGGIAPQAFITKVLL